MSEPRHRIVYDTIGKEFIVFEWHSTKQWYSLGRFETFAAAEAEILFVTGVTHRTLKAEYVGGVRSK